jgi:hypothetical protein
MAHAVAKMLLRVLDVDGVVRIVMGYARPTSHLEHFRKGAPAPCLCHLGMICVECDNRFSYYCRDWRSYHEEERVPRFGDIAARCLHGNLTLSSCLGFNKTCMFARCFGETGRSGHCEQCVDLVRYEQGKPPLPDYARVCHPRKKTYVVEYREAFKKFSTGATRAMLLVVLPSDIAKVVMSY